MKKARAPKIQLSAKILRREWFLLQPCCAPSITTPSPAIDSCEPCSSLLISLVRSSFCCMSATVRRFLATLFVFFAKPQRSCPLLVTTSRTADSFGRSQTRYSSSPSFNSNMNGNTVDLNHAILDKAVDALQDIVGTDAGGRGMKSLICPGDLLQASTILATLAPPSHVLILSGFPCCVNESPPTETDGPPGAVALVRTAFQLGHKVTLITDTCNEAVFAAALDKYLQQEEVSLEVFPGIMAPKEDARLQQLALSCGLIVACERAGPAKDGHSYTMRGIDMTERGLLAPLHRLVEQSSSPFLAIGDGGNEMGMGKVIDKIISNPKIQNGEKIGCVVKADYLVAASVSNWGGYALAAGAALMKSKLEHNMSTPLKERVREWVEKCVPTEEEEVALLERCVVKGCRDGVSGNVEATVDGMPLETSMKCLRDIRTTSLATSDEIGDYI